MGAAFKVRLFCTLKRCTSFLTYWGRREAVFITTWERLRTFCLLHHDFFILLYCHLKNTSNKNFWNVVKWFKYLMAINRINAIVNSRLIKHFFYAKYPLISLSHTFLILMLLSTWRSASACLVQMFFYDNNIGIYWSKQDDTKKMPIVQLNDEHTNILPWT